MLALDYSENNMIYGFVGLPGTGKTLSMVHRVAPLIKAGIKVYTNTPVNIRLSKYQPVYLPNKLLLEKFVTERNATFLIDEAQIVFDPNEWSRTSPVFLYKFSQGRKLHLDIYFTTQRFNHVLKRLRELTNYVIQCNRIALLNIFQNIWYDPDIYTKQHLFGSPMEKQYIRRRQLILPWEVKRATEFYDTNFLIEPFNAKDYSSIMAKYRKDEAGNLIIPTLPTPPKQNKSILEVSI